MKRAIQRLVKIYTTAESELRAMLKDLPNGEDNRDCDCAAPQIVYILETDTYTADYSANRRCCKCGGHREID
jgi:hypothetical protein